MDQFLLLTLWDELGIPHKPAKRVSGFPLTIIGINIDANKMTLSLPDSAKEQLTAELRFWSAKPPKGSSGSFKLKHWQCLAGWFNWVLNVYPLLRPALNNLYAKIAGKQQKDQRIYINNAIRDDLKWALTHLESSEGVHLFKSFSWSPSIADFVIYCDACPEGLGFWYPHSKEAYYGPTLVSVPTNAIFYFESLAVLSALVNVQRKAARGSKILIYTDNLNTIDMFRSLRCLPPYNRLLKRTVDILLQHDYSLRVLHVPGEQNTIADALSRVQFSVAFNLVPDLHFTTFNPPLRSGVSSMIHSQLPSRQPARSAWSRDKLLRERAITLGQAIDTSTLKNYSSALNSYLTFVRLRLHHLPVDPTPDTLSFFTVFMSHHINPKSVSAYLSGICQQLEPYFPNVHASRHMPLVDRTLKGCLHLRGSAVTRKRALTFTDLQLVLSDISSSNHHDDLLFKKSMLLTSFFALMRLGELTFPNNIKLRNWKKISK